MCNNATLIVNTATNFIPSSLHIDPECILAHSYVRYHLLHRVWCMRQKLNMIWFHRSIDDIPKYWSIFRGDYRLLWNISNITDSTSVVDYPRYQTDDRSWSRVLGRKKHQSVLVYNFTYIRYDIFVLIHRLVISL